MIGFRQQELKNRGKKTLLTGAYIVRETQSMHAVQILENEVGCKRVTGI
jgi:hypothetical protein